MPKATGAAKAKKPTVSKLTVTLSEELHARLEALALRMEQSPIEAAEQAIAEFVETWEDHLRVVKALAEDEARPVLIAKAEQD